MRATSQQEVVVAGFRPVVVVLLAIFVIPPCIAGEPVALEAEVRARLAELPEDPAPKSRRQGAHYFKGNEYHFQVFVPYIQDLGGALLGIGTDQNFTLADIAGSELVFIFDYDAIIVREMEIYLSFIRRCATSQELIDLWGDPDRGDEARAIINEDFGGKEKSALYLRVHKKYGERIGKHLKDSRKRAKKGTRLHWLVTEESYTRTRALVEAGRVVVLDGNLLGGVTVQGIADVLTELKMPVGVLYLSNAEEYWSRYTDGFESSMQALPMDDKTRVLRTFHDTKLPKIAPEKYYHYNVQAGQHLKECLAKEGRMRYRSMMAYVHKLGDGTSSELGL